MMEALQINTPQVKICGLTVVDEAVACVEAGADAIGLVFYPPSPRHVTRDQARAIAAALPYQVPAVGVFNDPSWDDLIQTIEYCGLGGVQLHGNEPPEWIDHLVNRYPIITLKGVFATKRPHMSQALRYKASAYLVECGNGPFPGGNALAWDWSSARDFASEHLTVLAGGLNPDNVVEAIRACLPDAVDASSGLEAAPGRKNADKVARFIAKVRRTADIYRVSAKTPAPIFRKGG